jgi:hypothetical protein
MRLIALSFIALLAYAQITQFPAAGGSSGNATTINGAAVPASQACLGSNSSRQVIAGTCGGTSVVGVASSSAGQTINATSANLSFDTDDSNNTPGIHETVTHPDRFTAPATGWYDAHFHVTTFSNLASSAVGFQILLNGSGIMNDSRTTGTTASGFSLDVEKKIFMTAGDYVVANFDASSNNITINAGGGMFGELAAIH